MSAGGSLRGAKVRLAEEEVARREKARQQKIHAAITKRILALQQKIQHLGYDIRLLREKETRLRSKGKMVRAGIAAWRLKQKQQQLEQLKKITPSIKS